MLIEKILANPEIIEYNCGEIELQFAVINHDHQKSQKNEK